MMYVCKVDLGAEPPPSCSCWERRRMSMLVGPFISQFIDLLFNCAKEETAMLLGVPGEIKKLVRRLSVIEKVVEDAERKQFHGQAIRRWVDDLKDIMYFAQDIIEDYKFEAENYLAESSSSSLVHCCYSPLACCKKVKLNHEIGYKIKNLNFRLEELNKDIGTLNLMRQSSTKRTGSGISRLTSPILEPDIVSSVIEEDTRHLVDLMITQNNQKNISIYAIVGMGGIGKTTLAQKICNSDIVRTNFHPLKPIWVCISKKNVDEIKILKSIIEGVGGDPSKVNSREQLEPLLYEVVAGKRFFLVLDDVWDARVWEHLLRRPLHSAAMGSKVLLTTRDERIARQMGAEHLQAVAKLSDAEGWLLLSKLVFRDGQEQEMQELRDLGIQIVSKCDGLPLAIRAVAGVLRTKELTTPEWENVLLSPAWSFNELPRDVQSALYLSYEDLSYNLKQCFMYFSLFPEDYNFEQEYLTCLWIAEGFVEVKQHTMLEETANKYWRELIQRNLLQMVNPFFCKMHDLLRTLAKHLARHECQSIDVKGLKDIDSESEKKARRLYIHGVVEFNCHVLQEYTSLRTLICPSPVGKLSMDDYTIPKHIRILNLGGSTIERLPGSFGKLIYLRYLDLSNSLIREMPDDIRFLRNLQLLSLTECSNVLTLPKAIGFLTNLRYLDVEGTKIDKIPKEMERLQQLRTLKGFVLPSRNNNVNHTMDNGYECCTMEDLREFKQLKYLSLLNLERTSGALETRAAGLGDKSHLTHLALHCDLEESYNEEGAKSITKVFEELCPPSCIEELFIEGYFGRIFPQWLRTKPSLLLNLRKLVLKDCPLCEELPPLGQLYHLTIFCVSWMPMLRRIGPELLLPAEEQCIVSRSFLKLESLCFDDLQCWEEWIWLDEKEDQNRHISLLPRLKEIQIQSCPELRFLPHLLLNHATSLKDLSIDEAGKLEVIENLNYINRLRIENCPSIKRVANLSSLKNLTTIRCENLSDVEHLPGLQILYHEDTQMKSLPKWLLQPSSGGLRFPKLQRIWIKGSPRLVFNCVLHGRYWNNIRDIPQFIASSANPYLFVSYTKYPFYFDTNIRLDSHTLEEMTKNWLTQVNSSHHEHVLLLMRRVIFRCDKCREDVDECSWSYFCEECGFDMCLTCALEEGKEQQH